VLVATLALARAAHAGVGATPIFPDLALPITGSPGQIITISNNLDGAIATRSWVWLTNGERANWELLDVSESADHTLASDGRSGNAEDGDYNTGIGGGPDDAQGSDYNAGSSGRLVNAAVTSSFEANFDFTDLILPDSGAPGQFITISTCISGELLSQQWRWTASDGNAGWQAIGAMDEANYDGSSDPAGNNNAYVELNACD
jgi:hypothetical protein